MQRYALLDRDGNARRLTHNSSNALPVEYPVPDVDRSTHYVKQKPVHQWQVLPDKVVVTYTITERDLEAEAAQQAERLRQQRESMVVSRFQARAVLRQMGLREQVDAIMAAPDADPLALDAWQDAQEFRRLSPTIIALADKLNLSDGQVDDMFKQAAQIEA